jgi:uncharacterized protein
MTKKKRVLTRCLGYPLAIYVGILLVFFFFEKSLVYKPTPSRDTYDMSVLPGVFCQELWLDSKDGTRVHAYFFSPDKELATNKPVVLYCHGNAGNISHRLIRLNAFAQAGIPILIMDYRGFGLTKGSPHEQGTYDDAAAGYQWLQTQGWESNQIIAHGTSLGGGIASWIQEQYQCGALVLESTFTSIPGVSKSLFPYLPTFIIRTQYPTLARVKKSTAPLLVIHGDEDEIIPFHMGKELYSSSISVQKSFYHVKGAGHDDIMDLTGSEYFSEYKKLLEILK